LFTPHIVLKRDLRKNVSFLSVDCEYNDGDEDDGQANENGDQEVHVQIEGNHSLNKLGVTTCENNMYF
jgi:hypothetical protein